MVYVSLDDIVIERIGVQLSLILDMHVVGFVPEDHREVMGFLTEVFERLQVDYLRIPPGELHDLGYMVVELSREKIYLTTIPDNTYSYDRCTSSGFKDWGCVPVYVYVDVGSPFRHFFHVHRVSPRFDSDASYTVYGVRYDGTEYVCIMVDFFRVLPLCTASFCTEEFKETVERLAADREIHVGVYPDANKRTKKLAEALLKRKRKEGEEKRG